MGKIICSISFYIAFTVNTILVLSDNIWMALIGIVMLVCLYKICKMIGGEMMTDILGIKWLQSKFKNNVVIMDMTNE